MHSTGGQQPSSISLPSMRAVQLRDASKGGADGKQSHRGRRAQLFMLSYLLTGIASGKQTELACDSRERRKRKHVPEFGHSRAAQSDRVRLRHAQEGPKGGREGASHGALPHPRLDSITCRSTRKTSPHPSQRRGAIARAGSRHSKPCRTIDSTHRLGMPVVGGTQERTPTGGRRIHTNANPRHPLTPRADEVLEAMSGTRVEHTMIPTPCQGETGAQMVSWR